MKKMGLFIMLFAIPFASIANTHSEQICIQKIESENNLPKGTFKAMMEVETGFSTIEKATEINKKHGLYGPVGINERAVRIVAKKTDLSEEKIKNDTCTNLEAVAFFLNKKGKDKPLDVKFENYHGRNIAAYNEKVHNLLEKK